jgi:hypothetical protein
VKIVADENVDKQTVHLLRANGHEVLFVAELDPGIDDETVLLLSRQSNSSSSVAQCLRTQIE